MTRLSASCFVMIGLILFAAPQPLQAADPAALPPFGPFISEGVIPNEQFVSVAEVRQAFDAADYRGALRKASQALALKMTPLSPDERYAVLMLRGESLLRLNERAYSIDAFDAASRAAGRKQIKKAAVAKANAVIIARAQGTLYKPTHGGGVMDAIDIVNPKSRWTAMRAAFDDLTAENLSRITRALENDTLPPMLDLVPALADMYVLESATDQPRQTSQVLKKFGAHARTLMQAEMIRIASRMDVLNDQASSWVGTDTGYGSHLDRRGLHSDERHELADLISYTGRILEAAQRARQLTLSFGFPGENWDPVIADAATLIERGAEILDRRY